MNQLRKTFQITNQHLQIVKNSFSIFAMSIFIFWMMAGLLPSYAYAETIKIGGTGGGIGTMRLLAQAFEKANPSDKVEVLKSLGSSGGVKALLSGAIDLSFTSRPLKKSERAGGAEGIEYGRTPFIFVTRNENKTSGLTLEEISQIYSGKTTRWPDGSPVRLILRPKTDSVTKLLKKMSDGMQRSVEMAYSRKGLLTGITDQDAADLLEKLPGAFGPSTLAVVLSEKRNLKPLSLNGVKPGPHAIANGSYPYSTRLFLVVRPTTQTSLAKRFVSFVLSPEGGKILSQTGHWTPHTKKNRRIAHSK